MVMRTVSLMDSVSMAIVVLALNAIGAWMVAIGWNVRGILCCLSGGVIAVSCLVYTQWVP